MLPFGSALRSLKLKTRSAIDNGSMNKRILCTTAALLTALGIPLSCYAQSTQAEKPSSKDKRAVSADTIPTAQLKNVVKVGEYQSTTESKARETVIARIQPHEVAGRQAVTLYVHNLPVITFFSSNSTPNSTTKVGATRDSDSPTDAQTKVATLGRLPDVSTQTISTGGSQSSDGLIWRATAVAAKLNQLSLDNLDASKVTVKWKSGGKSAPQKTPERYIIAVNNQELVEINADTRLADQTKNLAEDALQVTNRLRRLLGNASPLREIAGMPKPPIIPKLPKPPQSIAIGPVRFSLSGLASWYGPGFHGRRSANGEIYNQNALTAAHRSLPFGTRVRVTNTRTGRSVVVRINDRGPYAGGRIIDLSAAAAQILGVIHTGVAPVRVEVLGR